MKGSSVEGTSAQVRRLNAVALQNAVLCADCDVVSDSPNDRCLVCGSRSLLNISSMLGGSLPSERALLLPPVKPDSRLRELVLSFPQFHRIRKRASAKSPAEAVALEQTASQMPQARNLP
jgi:hypothetical protein